MESSQEDFSGADLKPTRAEQISRMRKQNKLRRTAAAIGVPILLTAAATGEQINTHEAHAAKGRTS